MSEDDVRVLVCPRKEDSEPGVPTEPGVCEECSHEVTIARSSRWLLERGARVVCMNCAGPMMDDDDEAVVLNASVRVYDPVYPWNVLSDRFEAPI